MFWAAWWTGEPTEKLWRAPDATGYGFLCNGVTVIKAAGGSPEHVHCRPDWWAHAAYLEKNDQAPEIKPPEEKPAKQPKSEWQKFWERRARRERKKAKVWEAAEAAWNARFDAAQAKREPRWRTSFIPIDPGPEAVRAFNLDPNVATEADIRAAFRARAKVEHPDLGGNGDIGKLRELKDLAIEHVNERGR
jgi:hypothetical protein